MATDFLSAGEEERIGINSIANCITQEGNPVKYDRRFFLVAKEQLARDI